MEPLRARLAALWRWFPQHPARTVVALWLGCVIVFAATLLVPRVDGQLVGSDGVSYYAGLRSLVIDHDQQLSNDYLRLNGAVLPGQETPKFALGVALFWLPFFLAAHALSLAGQALGLGVSADGYSWLYQGAVCFGSMVYGLAALLLMLRLAREFFSAGLALAATLLVWFGWNLVYYLVFENSMSHMIALLCVCALLAWWRFGPRGRPWYWLGIGALAGVAAMVRPQDAAFALVPGLDLLGLLWAAWRERSPATLRAALAAGALLGAGVIIGYLPQLVEATVVYGRPLANGYVVKGETFRWTRPALLAVLFSSWRGLFSWHALTLAAVLGLALWRPPGSYAGRLLAVFALQVYVVAAWHTWWQGDAFGSRMLINCAPAFALGLAELLRRLQARRLAWGARTAVALALVWNALFLVQYRLGFISMSSDPGWRELTLGKLTMLAALAHRVLR